MQAHRSRPRIPVHRPEAEIRAPHAVFQYAHLEAVTLRCAPLGHARAEPRCTIRSGPPGMTRQSKATNAGKRGFEALGRSPPAARHTRSIGCPRVKALCARLVGCIMSRFSQQFAAWCCSTSFGLRCNRRRTALGRAATWQNRRRSCNPSVRSLLDLFPAVAADSRTAAVDMICLRDPPHRSTHSACRPGSHIDTRTAWEWAGLRAR